MPESNSKSKTDFWESWLGQNARQRNDNVQAAVVLLERWIGDLIRKGIARIEYADQEAIATALTDLQAPALAQRVRELNFSGSLPQEWEQTLEELAMLSLWLRATRKARSADYFTLNLHQWAGVNIRKERVLRQGIRKKGVWHVWGKHSEVLETGLKASRTWLQESHSQTWALLLDFAFGRAKPEAPLEPGLSYDLELAFYPEVVPMRALMTENTGFNHFTTPAQLFPDVQSILEDYANLLSRWPWLEGYPTGLERAYIRQSDTLWVLTDEQGEGLPLRLEESVAWTLFAFALGQPVQVFGQWDGSAFLPLSARNEQGRRWYFET